jgi:tripartite-type tricarboxylate transporter receptor subunit TctC
VKNIRKLVAALILAPGMALAAYPDKPINMIVSYSPGGGTDLIARAIAPYIEKYLGNNAKIVIQNKPGAGGARLSVRRGIRRRRKAAGSAPSDNRGLFQVISA